MLEHTDPEFISSHRHTEVITMCRAIIGEKEQNLTEIQGTTIDG